MATRPLTQQEFSKKSRFMIKHGRETLTRIDDSKFVSKEPLGRTLKQKKEWLTRQQNAADTVSKLAKIGNKAYGVPRITSVDVGHFRIMEEKVDGVTLTPLLFRTLNGDTRAKIIDALAQFYADIHSIDMIPNPIEYRIGDGLYVAALEGFFLGDMNKYFPKSDVKFVDKMYQKIMNVSYESRLVLVHGDMCEDNVLYDYKTQKLNVIDFTETGKGFLFNDLLWYYPYDLGVVNQVRTQYLKYRDTRDLPEDFTDDARWEQISAYHKAASILENMNETVQDLQYIDKTERKDRIKEVKTQIDELYKCERGF